MSASRTIALDCMGGDHGPEVIIPGAAISLERHPQLKFQLVGDQKRIEAVLSAHSELQSKSVIIHTDIHIAMDDKPSLYRGELPGSACRPSLYVCLCE